MELILLIKEEGMKVIRIEDCSKCPHLKHKKNYYYCGRKFGNCTAAYNAGEVAEYDTELDWLFGMCTLEEEKK